MRIKTTSYSERLGKSAGYIRMSVDKIAFLDRDGTLVREPADNQIDRVDKIQLMPGVVPALLRLKAAGYEFVMVTNQDGLGSESFPAADYEICQDFILNLFKSQDIEFREIFVCPHTDEDRCACRKPLPGLLGDFLQRCNIDRENSFVVGDRDTDLEFAANIGVTGYQVDDNNQETWTNLVRNILDAPRCSSVVRETKETRIKVDLGLDQDSPIQISTGIGFFDHMLEQVAKHGGFSLVLNCQGDLEIDEHHTVEDTALALGQAMRACLGDKRGIARYGFTVPMDEAQAQVAIDLAGRPYFVFEGSFPRKEIGELPTELVPHFFRSLADSMGAAVHLSVKGENTHHMIEACFKATGRALRQAIRKEGSELPSTKGSL
jgi:imidazoleglycerol-phosphate dehydratase/histidinol-phosphatase